MATKVSSYLTKLGFRQLEHVADAANYNNETGGEYIVIRENTRIYLYDATSNAPIDSINVLPTSDGGTSRWMAIGGGAMTQYKISYTFESYSNEIPLGMTVLSKANIFYVNIENTQILSTEFNLNDAKDTIVLSKPFEAGVRTEVVIFVGDYQPESRDYELLTNKPMVNGITLVGNRSLGELGIQPTGDYATNTRVNTVENTLENKKANKATTLAGYNIGDAYTKTEVEQLINKKEHLPDQTGNQGKFLSTDGTNAAWVDVQDGTTTVKGVVKLATDTEIEEGTSETAVVVAKQLKATNSTVTGINARVSKNETDIANLGNTKADKTTTLAGYGITDAYTRNEVDNISTGLTTEIDKKANSDDVYTKSEIDTTVADLNQKITDKDSLPEQAGNTDKFLTTNGTEASWATIDKTTVGLNNVDNTSDLDKPISTAVQGALDGKQSSLTSVQLSAVNSGIDSTKVSTYDGYATTIASKADASDVTALQTTVEQHTTQIADKANSADVYTKTEVDAKLETVTIDESNLVHKTENEEIAGVKTFKDSIAFVGGDWDQGTINNVLQYNAPNGVSFVNTLVSNLGGEFDTDGDGTNEKIAAGFMYQGLSNYTSPQELMNTLRPRINVTPITGHMVFEGEGSAYMCGASAKDSITSKFVGLDETSGAKITYVSTGLIEASANSKFADGSVDSNAHLHIDAQFNQIDMSITNNLNSKTTGINLKDGVMTFTADSFVGLPEISSSDVTTALGYTPYNSTNPNGYQTASDVASAIASIPQFEIKIVDVLPATGQKMVLYLLPKTSVSGDNIYDEYIWLESTSSFELVGSTTVDLSDYYTKTETDQKLDTKQDTLTAGNGIKIENNTITNTYEVPENVVTSDNYVNSRLWKGTLAEYDALTTYDDAVTYFITDDNAQTQNTTLANKINALEARIAALEAQLNS